MDQPGFRHSASKTRVNALTAPSGLRAASCGFDFTINQEAIMLDRTWTTTVALALAAALTVGGAQAAEMKYPDWRGQWARFADQAQGGLGNFPTTTGRAAGMPHMMMAFYPLEFVVTPDCTYILIGMYDHYRRIYTDGRDWPENLEPSFQGYSIGKWIDEDGDGTYDVLEVETRGPFKGPRAYDELGLPLHFDNQSVFKERIYIDKTNPNLIHDVITTIDNALTRPWTVDKKYLRNPNPRPVWMEYDLMEANAQVMIGKENYFLSAEGLLMPTKKNQAPPDLRYFNQTR
jgi:hypothetical protein